ncbi:MAG: hypothetical protein RL885_29815 [Planctomycetota bacterium]
MYRCSQCSTLKNAPADLDLTPSSPWFKCPCGGTFFSDELTDQIRGEQRRERTRAGGFAHDKLLGTLIVVGGVVLVAAAAVLFMI